MALLRLRQSRRGSSPVVPIPYGDVQQAAPEAHRESHLEERKRLSRNPMKMLLLLLLGHRRRQRNTGIQHWLPSIGSILQRACTKWSAYRTLSHPMKNSGEPTWLAVELAIQSQSRITATRRSFDARWLILWTLRTCTQQQVPTLQRTGNSCVSTRLVGLRHAQQAS